MRCRVIIPQHSSMISEGVDALATTVLQGKPLCLWLGSNDMEQHCLAGAHVSWLPACSARESCRKSAPVRSSNAVHGRMPCR